jgi:hypothetical protein
VAVKSKPPAVRVVVDSKTVIATLSAVTARMLTAMCRGLWPLNTRIGQVDCACFLNAFLTLHVPSDIFQILRNVNHFIRLRQNTLPLDAEMIGFL